MPWPLATATRRSSAASDPGIVGTGTSFGHGALTLAEVANVAAALEGRPILAPRMSERDVRERHRGLSHHARAVQALSRVEIDVPSPDDAPDDWAQACAGLPLSHMGRGPDEDPVHFRAAFAAGLAARELVR